MPTHPQLGSNQHLWHQPASASPLAVTFNPDQNMFRLACEHLCFSSLIKRPLLRHLAISGTTRGKCLRVGYEEMGSLGQSQVSAAAWGEFLSSLRPFVYSLCTFSSPDGFTSFGIYCSGACLVVLFFFLVLLRREMLVVGGERISEVLFLQVLKRAAHSTGRDFLKSISTSVSVWLLLFQRYFLVCFSAEHISTQRKIEPCFCFVFSHSWILGCPEEPNIILCRSRGRGGGVGGVALQKNWCMWINAGSISPK